MDQFLSSPRLKFHLDTSLLEKLRQFIFPWLVVFFKNSDFLPKNWIPKHTESERILTWEGGRERKGNKLSISHMLKIHAYVSTWCPPHKFHVDIRIALYNVLPIKRKSPKFFSQFQYHTIKINDPAFLFFVVTWTMFNHKNNSFHFKKISVILLIFFSHARPKINQP